MNKVPLMEKLFPIMVAGGIVWYISDRVSNGASLLPVWLTTDYTLTDPEGQYNSGVRYVSPTSNTFPLFLTEDVKLMEQFDGPIAGMNTYYGPVEIESSDGKFYS